ncbi:MAG: aminodeoxychorismate/anthranilate synthase component II [Bernardetiaceae bacterium]|jgi:anthranilate synthase component 2|nr:aminodeoxychorismate/anthranilate synthase component II [Bernardetiaceae bacterium]
MKILVIDNYDSFTYNLVHLLKELGQQPVTIRNDKMRVEDVAEFDQILLSPGPGLPADAGIMPEVIKRYAPSKRILGVCLGHQAIGEAFGGQLRNLGEVVHGIATQTIVNEPDTRLFKGLPPRFDTCRYHSWVVDRAGFPASLQVTATDDQGVIMALQHRQYDVHGVQFHPESYITEFGKEMIRNWLN